jgi:hypothetical protein
MVKLYAPLVAHACAELQGRKKYNSCNYSADSATKWEIINNEKEIIKRNVGRYSGHSCWICMLASPAWYFER